MNNLHPITRALKTNRKAQLFASLFLSATLVLLAAYALPENFFVYIFAPGFLLTIRFFPEGFHGASSHWVAMIVVNIVLYGIALYTGLRLLSRRRQEH